jgi:hypothetical protein
VPHRAIAHPSYLSLIRELARNLERYIAGDPGALCGAHRIDEQICVCLRDPAHQGCHRCICGVEWEASSAAVPA